MDLTTALRSTGAVRSFTDEAVDDRTIVDILEAARFAPSGGNRQPWRVVSVRDRDLRSQLAELMRPVWNEYAAARADGERPFNPIDYRPPDRPEQLPDAPNELLDRLADAPAVLVVAVDLTQLAAMDVELDRMPVVGGASIYPFCWSILLAAHHHGLGGVLTTFLARSEERASALLELPEHHAIAAMIVLGHPVSRATRLTRRPVEEFASLDRFGGPPLTGG